MRWRNVLAVLAAAVAVVSILRLWPRERAVEPVAPKVKVDRVVLLTIDALRRDRLGLYGYEHMPTSPSLDAWAPYAAVFDNAFAPAPWTVPSLGAIFTNHHPFQIGAYTNSCGISPEFVTLPEIFQRNGFLTASFNTHALLINETIGFRRGFDEVFPSKADLPPSEDTHKMPYAHTEPALMAWLDKHAKDRFFLWIHDMDTHQPLTQGNTYLDNPKWPKYDAEVRWVDEAFGRLMRKLQALGIWDDSLIVFTADHGEALDEHGIIGHQDCMYDEVLRIPLMIQYPGLDGGRRILEQVESIDLFPTILELAGLPPEKGVGESLVPLMDGHHHRSKPYLFHSRYHYEKAYHEIAVRDRWWKLLVTVNDLNGVKNRDERRPPVFDLDASSTQFELYHPTTDPGEVHDLYDDYPDVVDRLQHVLAEWQASMRPPGKMAPELDEAGREALRALGYGDGN